MVALQSIIDFETNFYISFYKTILLNSRKWNFGIPLVVLFLKLMYAQTILNCLLLINLLS